MLFRILLLIATTTLGCPALFAAGPMKRYVDLENGRLVYARSPRGDRMPDFSFAGFAAGEPIPEVPVRAVVAPAPGECGPRIQAAIDSIARLPVVAAGFRGAVLLPSGRYEFAGQLRLASGVVLRGQGDTTVLVATGTDRRAVIEISGKRDQQFEDKPRTILDAYVPVNANQIRLESTVGLAVGDAVVVEHPSTEEWISALGMNRFPSRDRGSYLDWRPGTLDQCWDRRIAEIDGQSITLDAPLTSAIDSSLSPSHVRKYSWPGRLRRAGVENLRIESAFDSQNSLDEQHAWTGIVIEGAEDVWVRRVSFAHLAGSAVAIWESARHVTVADCQSSHPVSEIGGHRRLTFFTAGQQTLFLRCRAEEGRHDFSTGHLACGPNAFVNCRAERAHSFSGPTASWATGVLFDNVEIDGGGLALTNRETEDQGVGWATANSVLWNCTAPLITCRMPPTGQNWAIGVWGQFVGDGHWRDLNEFTDPDSLFAQQLRERIGPRAEEVLRPASIVAKVPGNPAIPRFDELPSPAGKAHASHSLALKNGWLAVDGAVLAGKRMNTVWWRGHTLPSRAAELGVGVTRFVPSRTGAGFTDNLDELTDQMLSDRTVALDHHWGLWYDRRRDDHQMLRRSDAAVWAPFYELPWARSGKGQAWDGLSRYDLTKFNPWYFARLAEFADQCDQKGLVLVQQMYFQHNILEAGAHWADFPWRPANCLQATGFPEPPEYVGRKRIFMADSFYDVSHPERRELHRRYIRHCLDVLGHKQNVVFQIGEEFTGPLLFVQFWLDTVAEWCREYDRPVLVGLSATKDVQDAVLADRERAKLVSVIDIKYWWYAPDGQIYDPPSAANLAPRQQLREWKGNKSRSSESIARAVKEYRSRFPNLAVTASLDGASGWDVLLAGGSLPALPRTTDRDLLAAVTRMKPVDDIAGKLPALADAQREMLVWASQGGEVSVDLSEAKLEYAVRWIDPATGVATAAGETVQGGGVLQFRSPGRGGSLLWFTHRAAVAEPGR